MEATLQRFRKKDNKGAEGVGIFIFSSVFVFYLFFDQMSDSEKIKSQLCMDLHEFSRLVAVGFTFPGDFSYTFDVFVVAELVRASWVCRIVATD